MTKILFVFLLVSGFRLKGRNDKRIMELLDKLGIDWRLLIAQIVNFLILLAVLTKVLYKPLVGKLEERRGKIQKGLQDAEEAHQARARADSEKQLIVAEARREALEVIKQARTEGEIQKQKLIEEGTAQKLELVRQGRSQIESEKARAMKEAESSIGGLVVKLTKKLIGEVLTKEQDKKLTQQVLESKD